MSRAIIAQITQVIQIPNAEKIQIGVVLGEQVIISKDIEVGDIGVFFPTETQLSEDYCKENSLFRHSHFNKDNTKAGFFEDNRKVKALKLLKVKSEGYFAPLDSLHYTGVTEFKLLDTFDELDGKKICCKYINEATRKAIANKNQPKQAKKNYAIHFEKHQETAQFKHQASLIPVGALLSYHSKRHGTSGRSGIVKVEIDLPKWKQIINKIYPIFPTTKFDHIVGSRNVVLMTPEKVGHHGKEEFRFSVANEIRPYLDKNMVAYYEIVGFVNSASIMPSHDVKAMKDKAYTKKYGDKIVYSYTCKEHEFKYHIYRLTYITEDGKNVDFSQKQLEQWCQDRNLPHTLEVSPQELYDGDVDKLMKKVELLTERPEYLTEDFIDPTHISEGIIIRVDVGKMQPYFLKSKSFAFRCLEGLAEALDPEDLEAA